jgi:hypothetical protein
MPREEAWEIDQQLGDKEGLTFERPRAGNLDSMPQLALTDVREVEAKDGRTSFTIGAGSGDAPLRLSQPATARLRTNSATKDMHATIDSR